MAGELGDPAAAANVTRSLRRTLPSSQTIADILGSRRARPPGTSVSWQESRDGSAARVTGLL